MEGVIQLTISRTGITREGRIRFCGEKHDTVTIHTVIHVDVPYSPEAYLQETGRAAKIKVLKRGFWKERITLVSPPAY